MTEAELDELERAHASGMKRGAVLLAYAQQAAEAIPGLIAEVRRLRAAEATQRAVVNAGVTEAVDASRIIRERGMQLLAAERLAEAIDRRVNFDGEGMGCTETYALLAAYREARR